MKLRTRRILYSLFIIAFFLSAPPLVLYTAGFRYDFEYGRVVETGSLVVRSGPKKASILLNGQIHDEVSPTIINDLLPGKINLQISKEGYHSWQQNIEIFPRTTTFEENIKLYPKTIPQTVINQDALNYWWNNDQDKFVYLNSDNQVRLYNFLNQTDTLIVNLGADNLINLIWSPKNDSFILSYGQNQNLKHFLVKTNPTAAFVDLEKNIGLELTAVKWDPKNSDTVYALHKNGLYRIPYLLKTARLIHEGPIIDYKAEKERILFIEQDQKNQINYASWINPAKPETINRLEARSLNNQDYFVETNSFRVGIKNDTDKTLTIIDPTVKDTKLEDPIVVLENVSQSSWSESGEKLIYSDGYAIYQRKFNNPITIIPSPNFSDLIIRYLDPIEKVIWADDEFHVFFVVNNTLRVAELKNSTQPRILTLLSSFPDVQKTDFIKKQESLTFIDSDNNLQILSLSIENPKSLFFGD